ncbi:MAG: hypothetical protein ACRENX_06335 [Candidatus Dormibacteria bacterium]
MGVAVGVGLGLGTAMVTRAVGQPNGTGFSEMVGVAEADGEACAWITTGVVRGQGGVGGIAVGEAALTISATNTARPPRIAVTTKATAPHSFFI